MTPRSAGRSIYPGLGALVLAAGASTRLGQPKQLNKRWNDGMSTSIALGASAAEREGLENLLVLTCDQITVTADHLVALQRAAHREHVVASTYAGRRGVPALFPAFSFPSLQQLAGDRGARELLAQEDVVGLPLQHGDFDIDTPEDLERLRELESAEIASK